MINGYVDEPAYLYPEFPRNYHYERRGALKIQGLA